MAEELPSILFYRHMDIETAIIMAKYVNIETSDESENEEQLIKYCKAKNCHTCSLQKLDQDPNFVVW